MGEGRGHAVRGFLTSPWCPRDPAAVPQARVSPAAFCWVGERVSGSAGGFGSRESYGQYRHFHGGPDRNLILTHEGGLAIRPPCYEE